MLAESPHWAKLLEGLVARGLKAETGARVLINDFRSGGVRPDLVLTNDLGEVVALIEVKAKLPKEVYVQAVGATGAPGFDADTYVSQVAIADTAELEPLVDAVIAENPGQVAAYRAGKEGLLGFFVGQVMKETGGKANPKVVNELLRERLKA